jgi:hypothetical protein
MRECVSAPDASTTTETARTISLAPPPLSGAYLRHGTRATRLGSAASRSTAGTSQSRSRYKDTRSAVTNGKRLHVVTPGNTAWARRFRDVLDQILDDITPTAGQLSEGQRQQCRRHVEAERLSGLEVDRELEFYRRLGRQIGRFLALLDAIDVSGGAVENVDAVGRVNCRRQTRCSSSVRFRAGFLLCWRASVASLTLGGRFGGCCTTHHNYVQNHELRPQNWPF